MTPECFWGEEEGQKARPPRWGRVGGRGSGLLPQSLGTFPGPRDQGRGRQPGRPLQVRQSALGRGSGRPAAGGVGARGCPAAPQPRASFPWRPCWSLAGTGHARGPELHPRPWLPRQGGGGRGLRDHPASNRKTRPSPGAAGAGLGAALPSDRWAWRPQPAEGARRREEADSAPGGTFGRSPGGDERGSGGRSARRPRRGVRLMDSAAREVAPRPLPPPPGCSPPHEPPELGSRSTQLAGAGTELLGE